MTEKAVESVRNSFVARFGEEQASLIEAAARKHQNGIHDKMGSDPFKWSICIAIGFQCVENTAYKKYHAITVPFPAFKKWVKTEGHLDTHDGDVDFIALFAGTYDEYMRKGKKKALHAKAKK